MANTVKGNITAFLWVIRHCEGTAGPDGYRTLFGGTLFESFDVHPNRKITARMGRQTITSTAAGAYQFLFRTWKNLSAQNKFTDFKPETQDLGAIALIRGRNALRDVEEGRFEIALAKCNKEWASLPGSPYGQPVKTIAYCKKIYEQYGGTYMVAPLLLAAASAAAPSFINAAFDALVKELPTLTKIFGSKSEVGQRNQKVVEATVNIVKDVLGAKNEQEAVEMIKADATNKEAADQAVRSQAWDLFGVDLSGVGAAREANIKNTENSVSFTKSPAFWISVLLLPLLYTTVIMTLGGSVDKGFTPEMKASTVAAVISGILGGVVGFWLGASFTTSRSRGLDARPQ